MSSFREEVELEISVRRLREQFHGNIPVDKATLLMRRYRNNHRMVAMEIILMRDRDLDKEDKWSLENDPVVRNVVQKLQAEEREQGKKDARSSGASNDSKRSDQPKTSKGPKEDRDIEELGKHLRVLPLTEKNKRMFDQAQKNQMPSAIHQFACETCDQVWWRRVPQRKRVSRCHRCKKKYDPVPPHKMWGIAEFFCPNCSRSFKGFGRMDVGSPCYTCRSIILPTQILPPRRHLRGQGPGRRQQHSCLAEDCYNRQEPHVPGTECVHPHSRHRNKKPQVVNPSVPHISSGSTVNTCLSQGSLMEQVFDLILDDIGEEESGEESDSSGSCHSVSS
ncbi:shiftless antiviral inhibitor of ribosomal frameshifting protein homolog isoform X2 [Salminus brasiliensis]|uniref:shiftless antiviral inhibitor of ribosomal frameshifting protein homolog isoform X2 n=1 Tax=Salminus brasiliensis TaxID=930266 RepID=UPI003B838B3C